MSAALPRVALVTNILPHYRVPAFEALAARLPGRVDVFVLADAMRHRRAVIAQAHPNLNVRVLPGFAWERPPFDDMHWNDPRPALAGYSLIILSGWDEPTFLALWALAPLKGARVAFWIESTLHDAPRDTWKESFKRLLMRRATGALVMGKNSAAYCEWLGVPPAKIFVAPNAADSTYFRAQAQALAPCREALRRPGERERVVLLFVGRMVERYKSVAVLLAAQEQLERQGLPAHLVLVGEGPDRPTYETFVRQYGLRHVRFENFMDREGLAREYAAADIFVLPSRSETWGLVINEAMEFALPIVTTEAVGAAADLVTSGEDGFVVPINDAKALAAAMGTLVRDETMRRTMGECARQRIVPYTPAAWADAFARGIERMLP